MGRMGPDGCLEHLGRKDFQLKIRGHRVEAAEVEKALLDSNDVREAAALAVEGRAALKIRTLQGDLSKRQLFPRGGSRDLRGSDRGGNARSSCRIPAPNGPLESCLQGPIRK